MSEQVATTRLARAKAFAVRQDLKAYVLGAYGAKAVQVLGDFGISVPPKSKVTKTAQDEGRCRRQSQGHARGASHDGKA